MMILSAPDGPVRPTAGAVRNAARHNELLGSHLDELKLLVLQWAEAHERLFLRGCGQRHGAVGHVDRENSDRPHSAASFSPQENSAGPTQGREKSRRQVSHSQPDPTGLCREDTKSLTDTLPPSPRTSNGVTFQETPDVVQVRDPLTASAPATGQSSSRESVKDAVFMTPHQLKEATQILGFSKRTQGRLSRNLSVLQQGLDTIMPSQGQVVQASLARFEKSGFFEFLCFSVITVNTVGLTVSTQRVADGKEEGQSLEDLELACCVFYVFELMIRLSVHQFRFFYRGAVAWNLFDVMLVIMALQEQADKGNEEGNNMSYLRATRILKVLKVLRIIRLLRFFKELRLILGGILASFKSLLWTVLLVAVITFMFSICFVQGMTGLMPEDHYVNWSNIFQGMVVLFMSGTGGIDWKEAMDPLEVCGGPVYMSAFLLYIFIFTFVIQNTITSLFVECLFEKQNSDEAFLISDRLERRAEYSARIQDLYSYMDTDRDGQVTYEELCSNLHDPRMVSFAESLEMELTDLRLFFNVLTCGGKNTIDIETFVVGCIKLRGNAKSIDLVDINRQLNKILSVVTISLEPIKMEIREVKYALESERRATDPTAAAPEQPWVPNDLICR